MVPTAASFTITWDGSSIASVFYQTLMTVIKAVKFAQRTLGDVSYTGSGGVGGVGDYACLVQTKKRPRGDLRTTNRQDSTDAPAMVASSISRIKKINFFGPQ